MSNSSIAFPLIPNQAVKPVDRYSAWVVATVMIAYMISFPIYKSSIFVVIPVALAGWIYGVRGGWMAGGIALALDMILIWLFRERGIERYFLQETKTLFFTGHFFVLALGIGLGKLREFTDNRIIANNELRSRDRYHTLLKITVSDILNPKKVENKYYYLIIHLANLFVADYSFLLRWDAKQEHVIVVEPFLPVEGRTQGLNQSEIIQSALQTQDAFNVINVLHLQDKINFTLFKDLASPIHSILAIPLVAQEYKLGTVILAYTSPRHFELPEIDNARQAGNQIALALWNVQQDVELKKRLQEVETLAQISRVLSETEHVGLETVLQLIVTSAKELIPSAQQAIIHLLDEDEQTLSPGAVAGFAKPTGPLSTHTKAKTPITEGVAGQVIASQKTINIADVKKDNRFIAFSTPPKFRSLMVAPVKSGDKRLGTISIQSGLVNAFTEDESRLLNALGTQAAIAIENANLLENTKQALKESNALYRINQELVSSLETQELLKDVVKLLQENFGYYYVQIYVVDPETGDFIMLEGSGELGRQLKEQGHRLVAGEGIVGHTAETGTAFFANDVDDIVSFVRNPLLPNTKSELAMPVKIGDRILGLLDIQQVPPAYLTKRDLQLVSAVADQLAIALQKANLYEELQTSLQHEKDIRNQLVQNERLAVMGRLLATVSHELNNPLQAIQNALFLLKEEKGISEQGRQDLNIVLAESEHMAAMLERLRDTYRPTRIQDFQPIQVNDTIEDVHALISTHLRHNAVALEFHPDPSLPQIPALADQLRQVILNLLMNAVEAMTNGGKLIVCTEFLKETYEVLITITDTGNGIDPSILPNIFDAFVTNKERGTGLGLTITYDIIMRHQGRIKAENNDGRGTTFSIWLPINNKVIT